jgi:hypothetical protein
VKLVRWDAAGSRSPVMRRGGRAETGADRRRRGAAVL